MPKQMLVYKACQYLSRLYQAPASKHLFKNEYSLRACLSFKKVLRAWIGSWLLERYF
jgi:hypothetical protein